MPGRSGLRWTLLGLPAAAPLAAVAVLALGHDPAAHRASRPMIHREDGFIGSDACRPCHADHHASWSRTFHRTMTQLPTPETIVGAFDGREVLYQGERARPFRRDGDFFLEIPSPGGGRRTARVALAVGSRRYQQYFERIEGEDGFAFRRLPILWHMGARRWLHLNTVFLGPDRPEWDAHAALWNDNCIFCHNTGPRPGETFRISSRGERQFDPRVAETGIACEACHGPGRSHAELGRDPLRRYGLERADDSGEIVDPRKLDPERALAVCGQCHGQHILADNRTLVRWLARGPTFRSGDRLEDHAVPLNRDTPSVAEEMPDLFRVRFWEDGTPRLTAYEYQGVVLSPCYRRGTMTCSSCHRMHGGDPRGMIEPALRGNAACTPCHKSIARDVRAHTFHDPERNGSDCMACHMPRIVYGILEIHRSHRVENPDPRRDGEAGRPHACTMCHVDRSLAWSALHMAQWWGPDYRAPRRRRDGAPVDAPDLVASLLAGDAVQRAVYAHAAGMPGRSLAPEHQATVRAALIATLGDAYPSVRWTAQRALLALEEQVPLGLLEELAAWDHTDAAARDVYSRLFDRMAREAPGRLPPPPPGLLLRDDFTPDTTALVRLLRLQEDRVIDIGE